jgi:hypothetical protein
MCGRFISPKAYPVKGLQLHAASSILQQLSLFQLFRSIVKNSRSSTANAGRHCTIAAGELPSLKGRYELQLQGWLHRTETYLCDSAASPFAPLGMALPGYLQRRV